MQDFEEPSDARARMSHPNAAENAAVRDERTIALCCRYESDDAFRAAVDDLVAATGLLLPERSLGHELDQVIDLARHKRELTRPDPGR